MGRLLKTQSQDTLVQLHDYGPLVDRLLAEADRHLLAEVASILALHVAYYESKYGPVPMEETTAMFGSRILTQEQGEQLAEAMKRLIIVIGMAANEGKDYRALH